MFWSRKECSKEYPECYNTLSARNPSVWDMPSHICAYCGKEMKQINKPGTNEWFSHCDCPDAKKEREIQLKIRELERQYPKPKYMISNEPTIIEIEH